MTTTVSAIHDALVEHERISGDLYTLVSECMENDGLNALVATLPDRAAIYLWRFAVMEGLV